MNEDNIVTLVGIRMAKPGMEFIFKGKIPDCNDCRFKNSCLNLDINGKYKVVNIRNTSPLDCSIHEGGVQAVDVIKMPWTVIVESRMAISGSTITYEPVQCNMIECPMYGLCLNPAMVNGGRYKILRIIGDPKNDCQKEYSLKMVEIVN